MTIVPRSDSSMVLPCSIIVCAPSLMVLVARMVPAPSEPDFTIVWESTSVSSSWTTQGNQMPPSRARLTTTCTYGVVVVLLQLSLLLLLPLGFHLHRLGDQVSQDGNWLGLADKWMLDIHTI